MGRKILIFAGISSVLQGVTQFVFSALAIAQYLGLIDFLRELPHLIFIKILYFHNPARYGNVITIGHAIDGIANQAFVLIAKEPFTATRTFIINCTNVALGFLWVISSSILLADGAITKLNSRPIRWPWVAVTVAVCAVDLVATVIFANDSFHTRTLSDIMKYIDGTASGVGGTSIDTSATAWIMVIIYSRFVIFFIQNVVVIILVALNKIKSNVTGLNLIENPEIAIPINFNTTVTEVNEPTISPILQAKIEADTKNHNFHDLSDIIEFVDDDSSVTEDINEKSEKKIHWFNIPRVYFSRAFRNMKKVMFVRDDPANSRDYWIDKVETPEDSSERSPQLQRANNRRAVNFPENLLSLPQRMENMIASEHQSLDRSVKDPSGAMSAPHLSQAKMNDTNPTYNTGCRDTAADLYPELYGHMPWSYIPAATYRPIYCDQPRAEDLPPIPLPDYTAIGVGSYRKASVHRAPSNLRMITRKEVSTVHLPRNLPLKKVDVLF